MGLSKAERETRDELIRNLWQAGVTYREIGRRVGLSKTVVHRVIKRRLEEDAERAEDLDDLSVTEHVGRLRSLMRASWAQAVKGDLRAIEQCRRLMESEARVKGLNTSVAERLAPAGHRDDDWDDDDDDLDVSADGDGGVVVRLDELRAFRARTAAGVSMQEDGTLMDCAGRDRSQEEMQRDIAAAAQGEG